MYITFTIVSIWHLCHHFMNLSLIINHLKLKTSDIDFSESGRRFKTFSQYLYALISIS
jgi:hypothetical protein